MRIKNPLKRFFKPKEIPDDPLTRIPEAWKKKKTPPQVDASTEAEQVQKTPKRGRGRPIKKMDNVPIAESEPEEVPQVESKSKPKLKYRPIRFRSTYHYRKINFKNLFSFRVLKRLIAFSMLACMGLFVAATLWQSTILPESPTYIIIIPILIGFILVDYILITGPSKSE